MLYIVQTFVNTYTKCMRMWLTRCLQTGSVIHYNGEFLKQHILDAERQNLFSLVIVRYLLWQKEGTIVHTLQVYTVLVQNVDVYIVEMYTTISTCLLQAYFYTFGTILLLLPSMIFNFVFYLLYDLYVKLIFTNKLNGKFKYISGLMCNLVSNSI